MFHTPAARVAARFPLGDPYKDNFESAFVVEDEGDAEEQTPTKFARPAESQRQQPGHAQHHQHRSVPVAGGSTAATHTPGRSWESLASELASQVASQVAEQVAATTADYAARRAIKHMQRHMQQQHQRRSRLDDVAGGDHAGMRRDRDAAAEEDKLFRRMMMMNMVQQQQNSRNAGQEYALLQSQMATTGSPPCPSSFDKWILGLCVVMVVVGLVLAACACAIIFKKQAYHTPPATHLPDGNAYQLAAPTPAQHAAFLAANYNYPMPLHVTYPPYPYYPPPPPAYVTAPTPGPAPHASMREALRDDVLRATATPAASPVSASDATRPSASIAPYDAWAQDLLDEANAVLKPHRPGTR